MFDFIKSINLYDDLKSNEIYTLFKTDSSSLNLKLLSSLQKFNKTKDFFDYYSEQSCQNVLDIFNNLSSITSKITEVYQVNSFKSEIDKYLSGISKIIYLFYLIQKNNELLSNLLNNTKKYLKKFCEENRNKSALKEKIKNCIDDLMNNSQLVSKRNYSRRSTKDNTISPSNIYFLLFQCCTPKFEEDDEEIVEVNEEPSCYNNINNINNESKSESKEKWIKKDSKKTIETNGSSLSIRHMKFVYDSDNESKRVVKKNKTIKMAINFSNPKSFFKKKSLSNQINENSRGKDTDSEKDYNEKSINSTKILTEFLTVISSLYKEGKINAQQKLSIKQLIISDSEKIIEKFSQYCLPNNNEANFINKHIKKFLFDKIKNLK